MSPPLHVLIFSKDRALQLASLLESLRDHVADVPLEVTVLHRASTQAFERGYALLQAQRLLPGLRWIPEVDFVADLRRLLGQIPAGETVMTLVDDDLFFRPVRLAPLLQAFSRRHLFVSLRADRRYPRHRLPRFRRTEPFLEWRWHDFGRAHVWQYPFSLDGNLFHAEDLARLVGRVAFRAPNSLEGALHRARRSPRLVLLRPLALAPLEAAVFNNPLNKVQTEGETWNVGQSVEQLNQAWLDGRRIDGEALYQSRPDDTHFAAAVALVPQRRAPDGGIPS
jgi:hypothetical protein